MQVGQLVIVRTDPATQFVGALAQHAAETADLITGAAIGQVDGGLSAGKTLKSRLRALLIASVQNLAWEIVLWGKDTYNTGAIADQFPLAQWNFAVNDGAQIAGTGLYYYYVDGLDAPYVDLDHTGELHLMLINRSATGKNAGADQILIQLQFEPALGW